MEVKFNLKIDGNGLYATKKYLKYEIIYVLSGQIFDEPSRETIYIGDGRHIYDNFGIFINHSFTPNVYIDNFNIIALTDIEEGHEITFDYNKNEITMASPFYEDGIKICGRCIY